MPSFLSAPSAVSELESEAVTVKVSNLPLKADKSYLAELFLESGDIESVTFVAHEAELNLPSKKALVKFTSRLGAENALRLNGRVHEDRHVQVEELIRETDYDRTVIVKNISKTATEEKLWKVFSKFGAVRSVEVKLGREDTLSAVIAFETKEARRLATKEHIALAGKVLKVVRRLSPEKREKKTQERLEKAREAQKLLGRGEKVEGEDWEMNPMEAQDVEFKNIRSCNSKKKQRRWMEEIMGKRKPKLTKEMGSAAAEARETKKKKKLDRERKEKENKEKVKRIKIRIKKI